MMPNKKYLFFISQDYSFPILRPLQKEIKNRNSNVKWFLYGDEIHKAYLRHDEEVLDSIEEVIAYSPDAVFVPGNVVPSFIPGLKIQVFHGLPGEKKRKNGIIYHYIIRGMFDLYCTQGPDSTNRFNQLQKHHKHFLVKETGWCKLDPLFPIKEKENHRRKKSIFFASTFSPRYSKADTLYPFLLKLMKKYDFQWYITLHPKMNKETLLRYKSIGLNNVHFIDPTELIPYMRASDVMICDISSIVYEYLTQYKPVITFQSPQKNKALINVNTFEDLEKTLLDVIHHPSKKLIQNIKHEVEMFHPYRDGKSSQRVLDHVEKMLEGKITLPSKRKPFNLIRNLQLRKALGYWK